MAMSGVKQTAAPTGVDRGWAPHRLALVPLARPRADGRGPPRQGGGLLRRTDLEVGGEVLVDAHGSAPRPLCLPNAKFYPRQPCPTVF
jgi:hypothetical protein